MVRLGKKVNPQFERQIKKGIMEMLVLQLLSEESNYGYQLLIRLADTPSGLLKVKEGTLYPILYRLEEDGMLKSGWQTGEGRAASKKCIRSRRMVRKNFSVRIRFGQPSFRMGRTVSNEI